MDFFRFDIVSLSKDHSRSSVPDLERLEAMRLDHPNGFLEGTFSDQPFDARSISQKEKQEKLEKVQKKAMSVATSGFQGLFMTGFMLWMVGSSLQIFSIIMLGMACFQPIKALLNFKAVFEKYAESGANLLIPRLIYICVQLGGLFLAFYKLKSMGLFPSGSEIEDVLRPVREYSVGIIL